MVRRVLRSQRLIQLFAVLLLLSSVVGCAATKAFRDGEKKMRRQDYDQAVLQYSKAVALKPGNSRYSISLSRAKLRSSSVHFEKGRRFAQANQLELAIADTQTRITLRGASLQLMRMDADGRNVRRVTPSEELSLLPEWDRSGRHILFTSYMKENPDLFRLTIGSEDYDKKYNLRVIPDRDSSAYLEGRAAHSLILEGRKQFEAEYKTSADAPVNH